MIIKIEPGMILSKRTSLVSWDKYVVRSCGATNVKLHPIGEQKRSSITIPVTKIESDYQIMCSTPSMINSILPAPGSVWRHKKTHKLVYCTGMSDSYDTHQLVPVLKKHMSKKITRVNTLEMYNTFDPMVVINATVKVHPNTGH